MNGSQFVQLYANKSLTAWEATALQLARQDELTPWPWIDLPLTNGTDTVVLQVQSDVLSIGPFEDSLRLPLTPGGAQNIFNLFGWLLPTPWLVYQIWRAAAYKLAPIRMVPTVSLPQYAAHSAAIDDQLRLLAPTPTPAGAVLASPQVQGIVAGHKKSVIVSNIYKPSTVLIFGWYNPPPAPDVFDDRKPMETPDRQPIQPLSNRHADYYVDYSHGIRAVAPFATVNGQQVATEEIYQDPVYSKLVSIEGPVRRVRYPASVPPKIARSVGGPVVRQAAIDVYEANTPDSASIALASLVRPR